MDTTRPATLTPNMDTEAGRRRVRDLTFLLAPPVTGEAADAIAETLARHPFDRDTLWVQMIRDAVVSLLEPDGNGRSLLDDILSDALGAPVTVWGVHGIEHFQCGRRIPGFMIETATILDAAGNPVERDFADRELRGSIVRALLRLTSADWATCTAAYAVTDSDELGFPNLAVYNGRTKSKEEGMAKQVGALTETDAAVAWAKAYNLANHAHLAPLLADRVCCTSLWASGEIENRRDYLRHFDGKIESLKRIGTVFFAEVGVTQRSPVYPKAPRPCVVVVDSGLLTATVLFEVDGGAITRIDESDFPAPKTCMLSGVRPGFLPVGGLHADEEPEA